MVKHFNVVLITGIGLLPKFHKGWKCFWLGALGLNLFIYEARYEGLTLPLKA